MPPVVVTPIGILHPALLCGPVPARPLRDAALANGQYTLKLYENVEARVLRKATVGNDVLHDAGEVADPWQIGAAVLLKPAPELLHFSVTQRPIGRNVDEQR